MISLEVAEGGSSKSSPYSLGLTQVPNVNHYVTERVEPSNAGIESAERKNYMTATTNIPEDILPQAQTTSRKNKRKTVVPPEPPDTTQTSMTYIDTEWTTKTADVLDRETTTAVRGTSNKSGSVGNTDDVDIARPFLFPTETNKSEIESKRTTMIPYSVLPVTDDSHAEATTDPPVINAGHVDGADTTDVKFTTVKADDFSHVTNYPNMEDPTGVADKSHSTKIAGNVDAKDGWNRSVTTKTTTNAAINERTANIPGDALPFGNDPDMVGVQDLPDKSDSTKMTDNTDTVTIEEGNIIAATETITTERSEIKEDITRGNVLKTTLGKLIAKYTTRTYSHNRVNPTADITSSIEAGTSDTIMGDSNVKDPKVTTTVDRLRIAMFTDKRDKSDFSGT